MSVDMYEYRFRQELNKVARFQPNDTRDPRVWPRPGSTEAEFPAWRALFTAMLLHRHSTGYRLFPYEEFYTFCKFAFTRQHPNPERFTRFFEGDLRIGMRQRVGAWYESGMAETYLYVCLVEALEDRTKLGVVQYDARVDWKLKADIMIYMRGGHMFRVNAHVGPSAERPHIEERRDEIERMRKRNTAESAHWGNQALAEMQTLEISITPEEMQTINGCRVFSIAAINKLLHQVYYHAEVLAGQHRFFPMPRGR
ncbi:hypothetical protein [Nocardia colli]|uniref:hypothetical protein n=1 Tax=Nocardia colli TaxID=2545717 RepID=UPI0035DDB368